MPDKSGELLMQEGARKLIRIYRTSWLNEGDPQEGRLELASSGCCSLNASRPEFAHNVTGNGLRGKVRRRKTPQRRV